MISILIAAQLATATPTPPALLDKGQLVFNAGVCFAHISDHDKWMLKQDIKLMPDFERGFLTVAWDEGFKYGLKRKPTLKACRRLLHSANS